MQPQRFGSGVGWEEGEGEAQGSPSEFLLHFLTGDGRKQGPCKARAPLSISLSRGKLFLCKARLEIPRITRSLMNLPQPNLRAQTKGEGESSTGTCSAFPTFLSCSLFPSRSLEPGGTFISWLYIKILSGFPTGAQQEEWGYTGSGEGPSWLPKSTLTSPRRCSHELWCVSTVAPHIIASYLGQGMVLLLRACTLFSTMGP